MVLDQRKYEHKHKSILRDIRPWGTRVSDALSTTTYSVTVFVGFATGVMMNDWVMAFADPIMIFLGLYFWWLVTRKKELAFKMPKGSPYPDPNNGRNGRPGKAEGILYLGNVQNTREEIWFTNSDARTHLLYLGTTGAGKTEGLKSMVTNAMAWGSGFVYIDGKADTDLWSSLSSLVRRFGRDDDLLVLNYMTGNSDVTAPSNTMNPFSSGSASYLVNMLVSLMPESGGDNAMWKERAVSLVGAMMPALTWKRDNQDMALSVRTIRDYLSLNNVIKLQRDSAVPPIIREGLAGYLDTLPGFVHEAYGDDGKVKPPGPDTPQYDTNTASQQHGYLSMQFTRSLQSLGDDYGYIFDTQAADVDMVDIVLNRRILIVLIPALEKSGDEIANLGKIVSATIKGMMGSTLGSTVEGSSATVIENKPTHSSTPFMTVFDEVGYYVAEGMAVMAAQARSLGFCLVFSGQDLPALKKRVREEANSITANCNIKIFGKLEDPTETKEFFEKTVGTAIVTEVSGFQMAGGSEFGSYFDTQQAGVQMRPRASYDTLRGYKEGQAVVTFGETVVDAGMFYANPGFAKAMRVTRFMALPPADEEILKHASNITKLRDLMVNKTWTAERADVAIETPKEIEALKNGFELVPQKKDISPVDRGIMAVVQVHALDNVIEALPPLTDAPVAPPPPPPPADMAPMAKRPDPPLSSAPAAPPEASQPASPPPAVNIPLPGKPAPEAPPVVNIPLPGKPESAPAEKASGNPMGFFGNNKDSAPSAPPPPTNTAASAPPPPTAQPAPEVNIPLPAKPVETSQAAAAPSASSAKPKQTLPKEILDIMQKAGDETRKKLFKDDDEIA